MQLCLKGSRISPRWLSSAQQVGSRIQAVNDELRGRRCTGKAGGGMVEAEVDGLGQVLRISIDPALVERKDRELMEDLIPAAVNAAIIKSKEMHAEVLRGLAGNIDLPGLKEVPGGRADRRRRRRGEQRIASVSRIGTKPCAADVLNPERANPEPLITQSVTKLIEQLAKLPGIGRKSAERLTYHLLRVSTSEALALADCIREVKENVRYCKTCFNLSETDECEICRDPRRNRAILCVVEQPRDLIALEGAGTYKGLYHVLLGRIAPLEGMGPDQLTIEALVNRVRTGEFKEVIMATNPTLEGDGTALFISQQLAEYPVELTRLARGITTGSVLEFANKEILTDALSGRQKF